LENYEINIDDVKPVYTFPPFLIFVIILTVLGAGYATVIFKVIPYMKKMEHIKNPPEGFWVCKKCGTDNTILQKECEKCGRPADKEILSD